MKKTIQKISATSLEGIDIFAGLEIDEREHIAGMCKAYSFQKGDIVLTHQDTSTDVFILVSGTVRITIYSNSGRQITFRDLSAGQVFGELSAIDNQPRSAHVVSLDSSVLTIVSASDFLRILCEYPVVNKNTLKYLTGLIRSLSERIVEYSTLGVSKRIHAELLRLGRTCDANASRITISPAPTHAELAHRVSTNREAVTREMSSLVKHGVIRKEGKTLIIQNLDKLRKSAEDVMDNPE
ncbi:MAG: cyclic nucleotide-binding domain-containing protein [Gammaproteobacteria bacterium]|nr:cyclic nucleotide-binding domain-containing protein [Gammaproteobacteria bacterium]